MFVDLIALLHELQHVSEADLQRPIDSRQLFQQNLAFVVVAERES